MSRLVPRVATWGRVRAILARVITSGAAVAACLAASAGSAYAAETKVSGVDPELAEMIARCAPTVHPETMAAVVSAESRGHQFAIADAGPVNLPWAQRKLLVRSLYPGTLAEAVATAKKLIASGHTVSLGVSQINDRNLARMGVAISDVFDPCTNMKVGGQILTDFYKKAAAKFGPGPTALRAALSGYNSGDWSRGAKDGYVDLVYKQIGRPLAISTKRNVPSLSVAAASTADGNAEGQAAQPSQRAFTMKASNFSVAEMN